MDYTSMKEVIESLGFPKAGETEISNEQLIFGRHDCSVEEYLCGISILEKTCEHVQRVALKGVRVVDYLEIGKIKISPRGNVRQAMFLSGLHHDTGKINWNTKFFDVFPELKADSNPAYADITLEDLFLCQAGIEPYTSGDQKFPEISPTAKNQKLEFAKYLLKQPPVSAKGNDGKFSFLYSNAGYTVAIVMLEKVSNKTYEKLLNETMKSNNLSFHIGWPNSISENQPWGHMIIDGKLQSFAPDHEYKLNDLITPAGGLSMNPLDYAKYTQLHLQGLRGQNNYLSSNTYKYIDFGYPGFSFGVANSVLGGYKYAGFDGSAGTFFCRSIVVPDSDFAFTVMMNEGSGTGTMKAVDWITMRIVKKHYNWWWKFWL